MRYFREALVEAEKSASSFERDQIAFLLAHANNANLISGGVEVATHPRLRANYEDCLTDASPPKGRAEVLLMCSQWREREDHVGHVADALIRAVVR